MAVNRARRIELEIDEIVLHGLSAAAADHLAAELRVQLARLLAEPAPTGVATGSGPDARPTTVRLTQGATAKQVSARVAHAVAVDVANRANVRDALHGTTSPGRT